jgi:hypothetical protein
LLFLLEADRYYGSARGCRIVRVGVLGRLP